MNIADLRMLPHKVLLKKCQNDHIRDDLGDVLLYVTDRHREDTCWCEIQKVGKCTHVDQVQVGNFWQLPNQSFKRYEAFDAFDEDGDLEKFVIVDERLIDEKRARINPFILVA